MDKAIEIFCAFIGAVWVYMGVFEYGFWTDKTPGGGFIPVLFGGLTVILCLVFLFRGQSKAVTINKHIWLPVLAVAAAMACISVLGMIATLLIMVFAWLRFYEKYTAVRAGIISGIVVAFVFGVFGMWLQVPFPAGLIGI